MPKGIYIRTKKVGGWKLSPITRQKMGENTRGEKHWNWQGGIEYFSIHSWLKKNFGKADRCEGENCKKDCFVYHWAKLQNKIYEKKRENFIRLCVRCHSKYDGTIEKLTKAKLKPIIAIKDGKILCFSSSKEASNKLNISRTAISNNLKKLCRFTGGFKFQYA